MLKVRFSQVATKAKAEGKVRKHPALQNGPAIEWTLVGEPGEFNFWKRKIKFRERRGVIQDRIKAHKVVKADKEKSKPSSLIDFLEVKKKEAERVLIPVARSLCIESDN